MTGSIRAALAAAALVVLLAAPATATNHDFPGTNPDESVRANTPNDPDFDGCEIDDAEGQSCTNPFDQALARFGFAPGATQHTALYKNPGDPHVARLMQQNTLAGRNPLGQVSGVSADRAWKRTPGDPSVRIAIIDTGIEWGKRGLRLRVALNSGELPKPRKADNSECAAYDCNADGAFNVDDYATDARVSKPAGHNEADAILDASDLLAAFSGDGDSDGNGFPDDIAGWDFFDDDNDPYDASSYSSGEGHGSGQAEEAAREGNDADGDLGVCPRCQIVPLRNWDSFVPDTNYFSQGVTYAADNGIEVVEGAIGGLYNSKYGQAAFDYAYRRGTFLAIVSSDINSGNHNVPTVYDESLYVAGTVADAEGLGENYPEQFNDFFGDFGISPISNVPVQTYFRNSGLTQYGGHAHIVMPAVTGSIGTGQASGAAGLIYSMARKKNLSPPIAPNEVKQLLTKTAEDVVPQNTIGTGTPDPAQPGWDQHFGYGRPDLGLALEWVDQGKIPPQVLIDSPDWFAPLNVERTKSVAIGARISAQRAAGYEWSLQWAPGIEPCEVDFKEVASGSGTAPREGTLGSIDLNAVRAALDARVTTTAAPDCNPPAPVTGGSTPDPTAPGKGPGDRDPNEPAFTVRVVVTDSPGRNVGEDRKVLFAHRDTTAHPGWSKHIGSGGEASPRMYDLDGDNRLDTIVPDSSGELTVYRHDGERLPSFNGGQPVRTRAYANAHDTAAHAAIGKPLEVLRTPAIGDVDGDGGADIVVSAGEHVYAWNARGDPLANFPVRLDPAKSEPAARTHQNHVKRGFFASPTLTDLSGDGRLDIAIAGMDQHLYAWHGDGAPLSGFPVKLKRPGETNAQVAGAESINTAAAGDIDGDKKPELIVATNEAEGIDDGLPELPGAPSLAGADGRVYAVNGKGQFLPGWPITPNALLPDVLPFVGPGVDHSLGDVTGDGKLDVIGNIATGSLTARDHTGVVLHEFTPTPPSGEHQDRTFIANAFDHPILADVDPVSAGPEVAKAGLTLQGAANLVAVGQNLPFNHVLQAWNGEDGNELPAYPQNIEDYVLLSSPSSADVSDAPGKELLIGTGMYLLRNMNAQGIEGTGWPKFTGGWINTVPATGDVDGDGKLEVSTVTREGNAFLWDTDSPACGTNDEWWTSHHDEFSTSAYGTDSRPPGTPGNLTATRQGNAVLLSWVAPGDDWLCGNAKSYRVSGIGTGDAAPLGQRQTRAVLDVGSRERISVAFVDEAGNPGHPAVVDVPRAEGETTTSPDGGGFGAGVPGGTPGVPPPADPGGGVPRVSIAAPDYASDVGRTPSFRVSWQATAPAGVEAYDVDVRKGGGKWRSLERGSQVTARLIRGSPGQTYSFRVRARSRDKLESGYVSDTTVVPLDDRSKRLSYSKAWRPVSSRASYGRTISAGPRHSTFRLRFRGSRVALIAPRGASGGRIAIHIDGRRRKVVHLRGAAAERQVVFRSPKLARKGKHTLVVRVLSRGATRLDAVAVHR